ncbi:MAG: isocitrate/isopropylmalate dehydrogenase family protein [Candidatus Firestonebacteria bacterium]|nr:isocitrate/isopropylmalate dehydrogenase family protein [Candidatus Firestonebacteria bacterium]
MTKIHNITFIPGDGTGPELSEVAKQCIEATGVKINWETEHAGIDIMEKTGTPLPDSVLNSIRKNKIAIKGPITTPVGKGFRSVNVSLRKALDLYACVRPCKSYKGVRSLYNDIDLIIIRENTEDLYAGIEFQIDKPDTLDLISQIEKLSGQKIKHDSGISIKPISVSGSKRIINFAFEYARKNNRRKVTAVHKANIMKFSDGLFLEVAREVAKNYTDIEFEDRIVDNMCMQLVQKPELYDVLVLPNLYGDIVSDLAAGLIGGLGMAPGANIGNEAAIFEPTHGSAPKYKGLNRVNPCALILSGVIMLKYIGENDAGDRLEKAVAQVIEDGKYVTYDLKPNPSQPDAVGTIEMGNAIIKTLVNL